MNRAADASDAAMELNRAMQNLQQEVLTQQADLHLITFIWDAAVNLTC